MQALNPSLKNSEQNKPLDSPTLTNDMAFFDRTEHTNERITEKNEPNSSRANTEGSNI